MSGKYILIVARMNIYTVAVQKSESTNQKNAGRVRYASVTVI